MAFRGGRNLSVKIQPVASAGPPGATMPTQRVSPTLRERLAFAVQAPCDIALKLACGSYPTFLGAFKLLSPRYLAWASRTKARKAYYRALDRVPAYAAYVDARRDASTPE